MKKILIALDYAPTATAVAEKGYELAKSMLAEVVLMHVIADTSTYSSTAYSPVMGFGGYMDLDYLQPDIQDELKKVSFEFLDTIKKHLRDPSIEFLVKEGNISECIIETAKELNAGLIVIGTHSQRWLAEMVMGNVAENVLRNSAIPVYCIPTKKVI